MIKIPVMLNFEYTRQIGTLEVDETQLPPIPKFCFSIGYSLLDSDTGKYELVCVSPVMDELYKKYLDNYVPIGNF